MILTNTEFLVPATLRTLLLTAFGSPTFFVGSEMFFGKEQLRDVEELASGR